MPPSERPQPDRLTQSGGSVGTLLEASEEQFREGLDETAAWRRLRERQAKAARTRSGLLVMALAGSMAAGAALWLHGRHAPMVTAEPIATRQIRDDVPPSPIAPPTDDRPANAVPMVRPRADLATRPAQPESTCAELKSRGQIAQAVECYEQLGTDPALYEAGRLSAKDLRDPKLALRLLDQRNAQFPAGPMRFEAELLRARLLANQGRPSDALAVTDRLLADPSHRLALPQIHSLRGQLFQDALNDCSHAVTEFTALVGVPGEIGDDGELRRATCLENMGRREEAREAFERYLTRPDAKAAATARAHLDALRPGSTGQ